MTRRDGPVLPVTEDLHLDALGAAWLPRERLLAVSDTHVGYEAAFRQAGAGLPRYGTDALIHVLDALVDRHAPDTLLVNGDFKHGFRRRLLDEARDVRRVWARLAERVPRVVLVEGNHDVYLDKLLADAEVVPEHRAGRFVFTHGHRADVHVRDGDTLVVGHEHPAITLRDEIGAGVRTRVFLHRSGGPDADALVLPALSPWAAGVDILGRSGFAGPLLADASRDAFKAFVLAEDEVLDFGEIRRLRKVLRRR